MNGSVNPARLRAEPNTTKDQKVARRIHIIMRDTSTAAAANVALQSLPKLPIYSQSFGLSSGKTSYLSER